MPSNSGENSWNVSLLWQCKGLKLRAYPTIDAGELEDEETSIEGDDNDVDGGLMELKCQEGDTTLNWELGEVKEVNGTAEKLEFGRE